MGRPSLYTALLLAAWAVSQPLAGRGQHGAPVGQACPEDNHPLYKQIDRDLELWAKGGGIGPTNYRATLRHCSDIAPFHVCIRIQNGIPYIVSKGPDLSHNNHGLYTGFLAELVEVALRYPLPDALFALHVSDRPKVSLATHRQPDGSVSPARLPVSLGYSKTENFGEVLIPFAAHFRCYSNAFDDLVSQVSHYNAVPWASRQPKALGRYNLFCTNDEYRPLLNGSKTERYPCARQHLLDLMKSHSHLLDVALPDKEDSYLPFPKHADYKYLLSTDGWTASSKLAKYFLLRSTVLKAESPLIEYYYHLLEPGVHYEPFYVNGPNDLLQEVLPRLQADDARAQRIAAAGQDFALRMLTRQPRLCYWRKVIQRMAALQKQPPSPCSVVPLPLPPVEPQMDLGEGKCTLLVPWMLHYLKRGSEACDAMSQLQEVLRSLPPEALARAGMAQTASG